MNIGKENNLLSAKVIYDLTKFTHLDYENHLSCIVWFSSCNMRCDYCYNKEIVFSKNGDYSYNDVLEFLSTRINLLDAVVLSGGEATSHSLVEFCKEIKKLGFKIKLDTNGTNFLEIKKLIELELLDYIALDYKAPKNKFTKITHSNKYDEFSKTLDLIIDASISFETRTTLHNDLLNENDINKIIDDLVQRKYLGKYYIQRFLETDINIGNLSEASMEFDKSLLSDKIKVIWR
ncbi:anaerobic ribonucleoside-triphosphate reductase activating protein [Sulfurimonas sp.]|uniref:anaerobic ribonucleoside-triphosphate reductase activating protein n=1 Tax=Sulfurimonas sp. TaxID=2022749 RepID=UPI002B45DFBC|nr:anaerobic ribonucleoside-triphosphate reductase activating protein [Sulfurimonas sp.]